MRARAWTALRWPVGARAYRLEKAVKWRDEKEAREPVHLAAAPSRAEPRRAALSRAHIAAQTRPGLRRHCDSPTWRTALQSIVPRRTVVCSEGVWARASICGHAPCSQLPWARRACKPDCVQLQTHRICTRSDGCGCTAATQHAGMQRAGMRPMASLTRRRSRSKMQKRSAAAQICRRIRSTHVATQRMLQLSTPPDPPTH